MDELTISFYERRSRHLFGDALPQSEIIRDLDLHARVVIDAVQEEYARAIGTAQKLRTSEGNEYILYGVGRRMSMILFSLRSLLQIAPPDREAPIDVEEGRALTRDLNVVYINIVGVLDNLAWAAFFERAPEIVQRLRPTHVGLFTRTMTETRELEPIAAAVEPFRAWFEELRARRGRAIRRALRGRCCEHSEKTCSQFGIMLSVSCV